MARSVANLRANAETSGSDKRLGLIVYPYEETVSKPVSRADRAHIIPILNSDSTILLAREKFFDAVSRFGIAETAGKGIVYEAWYEIRSYLNSIIDPDNDLNLDRRSVTLFDRFCFSQQWCVDNFIRKFCRFTPDRFNKPGVSWEIESIFITSFNFTAREFIYISSPPPYEDVYDFLFALSGRRAWVETKYERKSESRDVYVLMHATAVDPVPAGTLYLIALDQATLLRVRSGQYEGLSPNEVNKIGDVIIESPYNEVGFRRSTSYNQTIDNLVWRLKYVVNDLRNCLVESINSSEAVPVTRTSIIECESGIEEKLKLLDEYVYENPRKPVSSIILEAFTVGDKKQNIGDITALPELPPFLWNQDRTLVDGGSSRDRLESPPEFISRVYGEWMGRGFTRAHVRRLDPSLYQALTNWQRKNELPPDFDLPTLAEQNTRQLKDARTPYGGDDVSDLAARRSYREVERLRHARRRREQERD